MSDGSVVVDIKNPNQMLIINPERVCATGFLGVGKISLARFRTKEEQLMEANAGNRFIATDGVKKEDGDDVVMKLEDLSVNQSRELSQMEETSRASRKRSHGNSAGSSTAQSKRYRVENSSGVKSQSWEPQDDQKAACRFCSKSVPGQSCSRCRSVPCK